MRSGLHSAARARQVPEIECVVYPANRVRRPVPEIKAIARAVEMIRVRPRGCLRGHAATPLCMGMRFCSVLVPRTPYECCAVMSQVNKRQLDK